MAADRDVLTRKTPPAGVAQQLAAPIEEIEEVTGRYTGIDLDVKRLQRWKEEITPVIHGTNAKVDTLLTFAAKADAERERRAALDAETRATKAAQDATALASKRSHVITVIKTLGVAAALVAAAIVGKGAL